MEDHDLYGGTTPERHDRADGSGRTDERRRLSGIRGASASADAVSKPRGRDGQPAGTQSSAVRTAIGRAGARLLYLPSCSADFNPIENAFSKLEAALRKAGARTIPQLWDVIARALPTYTPAECTNYFTAAGYEPD